MQEDYQLVGLATGEYICLSVQVKANTWAVLSGGAEGAELLPGASGKRKDSRSVSTVKSASKLSMVLDKYSYLKVYPVNEKCNKGL